MTRLFGCICNQPEQLARALEPIRHLLVAEAPVARWGLGSIQNSEVLLSRTPRRSDRDVDFYQSLARVRSDYVIAHAAEDDGLSGNENTQPFRYRRWVFAQEGVVSEPGPVLARLRERIPEFLQRSIQGKTVAEHVFMVLMAALHEAGAMDEVNLAAANGRRVLARGILQVEENLRAAGVSEPAGNLIVSNGRFLMAVCLDQPLYMRRLVLPEIRGPGPRSPVTFKGILALSTGADPGEGFEQVPRRSIVLVSRNVLAEVMAL